MTIQTHMVGEHGCHRCGRAIPQIVREDGSTPPLFLGDRVGIIESRATPASTYLIGEHDSNQPCQAK